MTIPDRLNQIKKDCDKQARSLQKEFAVFKQEVAAQIEPLNAFMTERLLIEKLEKGKDINISPAVWNIIKWLLLFIGALVTGRAVL